MSDIPRILILEDNPSDAELAEHELRKSLRNCQILRVQTEQDYTEALTSFHPDLVLADYSLPQFSGLKALQTILDRDLPIPVIILTGLSNEEIAVECMKAGAVNYVLKENLKRLGTAATQALKENKTRVERNQAYELLKRNEEALRQRNEELARLYRASGSLIAANSMNLAEQANSIVSIIQQEFGQSNCGLILVQKGTGDLKQIAIVGPYSSQARYKVLKADGPGIIASAIRSGKAINVPDVSQASDYLPCWEAAQSELVIPLQAGSEVIGAIDLQSAHKGAFTSDDERVMSIFSERAALALERSRLNAQTESRLQQLLSLRMIDMAISSSFDITFTLQILLNQVIEHLNVHAADVFVSSADSQILQLTAEQGFHVQRRQHSFVNVHTDLAGQVIHTRNMVEIHDLGEQASMFSLMVDIATEGFQAYIGIPLIAKGQVKGVLELFQRKPLDLNEDQRNFLDMLAGQAAIAIDNAQLFENMQNYNAELTTAYDETIQGWSQAMDLRDKETEGHSRRVTEGTVNLATTLGIRPDELVHMRRGALLHDIGKIGVPDDILRKPSSLNDEEWAIMRQHPQFAFDMLFPIAYLHPALDIPYCHHEKWDGSGYPRRLKGTQIPLAARIFAVVDVWDALTSDRPYRGAWTKQKATNYIQEQSGKHFDPQIADAFLGGRATM